MSYTLESGVTAGTVEYDGDRYAIRERELVVDDYATASALERAFRHLRWPDGDPGGPGADSDSDVADDDLDSLAYSELQARAKALDIKANQSTDDLIAAIRDAR